MLPEMDGFPISTIDYDFMTDTETSTAGDSQASTQAEGALRIESTVTAGTSQSGRVCTMSHRMAEFTSQRGFFGNVGMHYMAHQLTTSRDETPEDLFHDQHLELLEHMQNPIAFMPR